MSLKLHREAGTTGDPCQLGSHIESFDSPERTGEKPSDDFFRMIRMCWGRYEMMRPTHNAEERRVLGRSCVCGGRGERWQTEKGEQESHIIAYDGRHDRLEFDVHVASVAYRED